MNTTIQNTIDFIKSYRNMERGTLAHAKDIIYQLPDDESHDHLFRAWKGKEKNFGDWFLNLSHSTQCYLIRLFGQGINDTSIDEYIKLKNDDPISALWMDAPPLVFRYHELVKFFYNHGINEEPAQGITLTDLPIPEKQYGNSTNWADYILSLDAEKQLSVVADIIEYIYSHKTFFKTS
jgi:hypothetical protein